MQFAITDPPVITTLTSNDNNIDIIDSAIRVLRGDDINVVCTSDANPPAMVLWRDQRIQSPTLHVKSEQHDAVWTCQASNSMTDFDGVTSTSTVTKNVSASVLCKNGSSSYSDYFVYCLSFVDVNVC
ncbi:hypothetical protein DPMN_142659 [Dreissena polymorpha]|uniref:Ig-like domain-containing protein n=1 Tax=Dreissena polymorpha TaxID=45954 RepID=A0A9D4GEU1_DREPO|nr:hypothetical protein DPMN_142659 [Dreissena polymorpha]